MVSQLLARVLRMCGNTASGFSAVHWYGRGECCWSETRTQSHSEGFGIGGRPVEAHELESASSELCVKPAGAPADELLSCHLSCLL